LQREPDSGVVIDASGLQNIDSAALAVLLECRRLAQAWGKSFAVRQAPSKLAALAKLYGVDTLLLRGDGAPV
jgi:phospholipid transport system transporter-binding protein